MSRPAAGLAALLIAVVLCGVPGAARGQTFDSDDAGRPAPWCSWLDTSVTPNVPRRCNSTTPLPVITPGAPPATGATPVDQPVDRRLTTVAAGGTLTITLTAVPVGQRGRITALGVTASDFTVLRTTTRVNGIAVAPLILSLGAQGTLQYPTPLASPIVLVAGDVFSLLLENTGTASIQIAGRVLGWTAP